MELAMMRSRLAQKYGSHSEAVIEYKEFHGRAHLTLGQEVADYALDRAVETPAASVAA
jgi:hypothetical protein